MSGTTLLPTLVSTTSTAVSMAITNSTMTTTTVKPYIIVTDKAAAELPPNISLYGVNIIVGSVCMIAVCVNFGVFISYKKFRQQYSIIIVLCIAEMFAELGIILEATTRRELFFKVLETRKADVMNSRDCLQPWVLIQTIGDFCCPSLEFLMGLERMCAISFPTVFRRIFAFHTQKFVLLATLIAGIFVLTPTAISAVWPTEGVKWSCGRKAAYGANFGLVDYAYNVFGFTLAFIFNMVAMSKAVRVKQNGRNVTKGNVLVGRNMAKLKCYTAISLVSMLLISIPNLLSIFNVFVIVPQELMTPAPILACINGAVQLCVHLTFNPEFRQRFLQIATFNKFKRIVKPLPISTFTQIPTSSMTRTTSTASWVQIAPIKVH